MPGAGAAAATGAAAGTSPSGAATGTSAAGTGAAGASCAGTGSGTAGKAGSAAGCSAPGNAGAGSGCGAAACGAGTGSGNAATGAGASGCGAVWSGAEQGRIFDVVVAVCCGDRERLPALRAESCGAGQRGAAVRTYHNQPLSWFSFPSLLYIATSSSATYSRYLRGAYKVCFRPHRAGNPISDRGENMPMHSLCLWRHLSMNTLPLAARHASTSGFFMSYVVLTVSPGAA